MLKMDPGLLNKRITFLIQTEETDSFGGQQDTWNDLVTVWANIKPLQGRELFLAQQVHNQLTTSIIIRYRADITPDMRIKYGNRLLEIASPPINMEEKNRFLQLICKEVV